ncbi:hypothetical protein DSCO28_71890 [Desulfosarcina ovata subsp. sediminis]|uniref:Uncharacterized protein n=1 Tax=Desulfosarcina ovata subsp. sediminis TaxID=885957 RepID=A0A5K8A244_9BACT|nr:hypothetical protein [Desulfosarcina ovata]BBO86623.1 hypothetical protein DSCO28_71890 [Desulfosarcina ovata subsp. sediminis]
MKRPRLRRIDHEQAVKDMLACKPEIYVTMDPGAWDSLLAEAYRVGAVLLEVVEGDRGIYYTAAYQKEGK